MFSLQDALTLPDPAYSFMWSVLNMSVPPVLAQKMPNYDYKRYIHSVGLTHPTFQSAPAFRHAQNKYYIGQSDVNSVTINFYEDANYTTHKWIASWRAAFRTSRFQYAVAMDYKGSMDVAMLSGLVEEGVATTSDYDDEGNNMGETPVGTDSISLIARLLGIFPTTQSPTDLDFSRGDRIIVPIEFQVDDVKYLTNNGTIES